MPRRTVDIDYVFVPFTSKMGIATGIASGDPKRFLSRPGCEHGSPVLLGMT
jgi:hypothetical protein